MSKPAKSAESTSKATLRASAKGPQLERGAALGLLQTCVATDVRCVAEIVRHVRAAPLASRKLLEDVLAIEKAHANELIALLRAHRIAV